VHTNNIITATGVASGTMTSLLAQATPADRLGVIGALMALLVLIVRTLNELGKGWLDYKEAQIREGDLKKQIVELEGERDKVLKLAAHGICPLSADGSPACNRKFATENKS
jgi:hypothetical protein